MEEIKSEPKRFNKKKVLPLVILGLVAIGLVSAVLVEYLSNTVSEDITVGSPILLEETEFELEIDVAGEDGFMLVKITNNADVDITGDVEIAISKWEGSSYVALSDTDGIDIAVTEDINYCFSGQGNMDGVAGNCEANYMEWMGNNIDWNDWYANEEYSDVVYPSPLVINHGGNSFHNLGYVNNKLILPDQTIPSEAQIYGVIYVATDIALEPTSYRFGVTLVP